MICNSKMERREKKKIQLSFPVIKVVLIPGAYTNQKTQ